MGGQPQVFEPTAFFQLDIFRRDSLGVLEVRELCHPVVALLAQEASQIDQIRGACAVVEPDHTKKFILPAEFSPVAQRARRQLAKLIAKVSVYHWNHAGVAGIFLILCEGLEHHDARPPVVIGRGSDHSARRLVIKRPIDEPLRLGLEASIIQQPGKRYEAVKKVRTALPRFTFAA